MPESAEESRQEEVSVGPPFRAPAAAQRDEDVIAEPRRERDMPPSPELRGALGEIRICKIPREVNPE